MFSTEGHPEACLGALAWPNDAGRFNWNAAKWNSSWAALCCPSLLIPHLAQPPAKYIRKDVTVNWCCRAKTTHLQKVCFSRSAHFTIGTCCRNCILDYPIDFTAGPGAKKLTQHFIYGVITATRLLLWQQENCMWLKKAHHLSYSPTLYSEEMRQGYTVQSSENHVRPNKSIYRSLASELTSLPWLSADHSGV